MEFSPGVAEKLGFYVYELIDPADEKVFYVGKGLGNRVHAHAAWADRSETEKSATIKQIRSETGREPIHRIVAHSLSEESAFLLEAVLIEHFGLSSLKNRVRGHGHDKLMLDVSDVNIMYAARTVAAETITVPTLFISLNGGRNNPPYPVIKSNPALLQSRTVGDWKVSEHKANVIEQVAGCYAGIVRVVFPVTGWQPALGYPKGPRKRFLTAGEDPANDLVGARVESATRGIITVFSSGREKAYAGLPARVM